MSKETVDFDADSTARQLNNIVKTKYTKKRTKVTVEFGTDSTAKQLVNTLKANSKKDLIKYNIKIVKIQREENTIRLDSGEKIAVTPSEYRKYQKLGSTQRRKAVAQTVFFKAQGTFKGSKPSPRSPFPTATPFFSNGILGAQIFSGNVTEKDLHYKLSKSLADVHIRTGQLGDWRLTHARQYDGYFSYRYEVFVRVALGKIPRNIILKSRKVESE